MTLPPLIPTPAQESAIWKAAYEPTNACLNSSELGQGKTLFAVEVAKARGVKTMLVICPLGTLTGWRVTAERQGLDIPYRWIRNTKDGLAALTELKKGVPGLYCVGQEYFTRLGWKGKQRTTHWQRVFPDMIVFDEVHRGSNKKTKTYRTLQKATHDNYLRGRYKLAMSATPTGNRFEGAWAITRWLWPDDDVVPASFMLWVGKWCKTEYDPFSFTHKKVLGELNPGEFFASLPCHIHLEAPKGSRVDITKYVELSSKQRKMYTDLEEDYLTWLEEQPLIVQLPIVMRIRQRQVTLAELTIDPDGIVTFPENAHSSKTDEVLEIIRSDIEEESALIYSDSRKFNQNVLIPRIRNAGYSVEAWDGSVPQHEREEIKQRFISGETKYLVTVIAAGGTGVDGFQLATRNVIWVTKSENGIDNEQGDGRVNRQGQLETVRNFHIEALDTRDQKSYTSLTDEVIARRKVLKGRTE